MPAESPTPGFTHLQFEALLTAVRESAHPWDYALAAMLGLLGLRIFEATSADIADLGEGHGHRSRGPILLNSRGARMDRHAATRRLCQLAEVAGIQVTRANPHMLRHTFVTTMLNAGVDLRGRANRRPPRRPTHHYALRPPPNYILAAFMPSGT